jgi:predicted dehydrogenase
MPKIKYAVIGVGFLGKFHAEKFAQLPNAELIAVCDTNFERAQEIATLHNTKAYNNYHSLLGEVDAVSIVASTAAHYEIAKTFLMHNTHVLVEKPITTTIAEADELIALAKKNNLVLQVGHLERFNPVLLKFKALLQKPLFIESLRIAPFKLRGTDVNVILDLMIHDIDIIQNLVKSPIVAIHANGAPVLSNKIDIANARIEFATGCIANFTASRISIKPKRLLRVFQHNAYLAGDLDNKVLSIHRKGSHELFPGIPEIVHEELILDKGDALLDEIAAFLTSIINGTPPIISGEDGKLALETAINITQICQNNLAKCLSLNKIA